jgi:hypothetical protein
LMVFVSADARQVVVIGSDPVNIVHVLVSTVND